MDNTNKFKALLWKNYLIQISEWPSLLKGNILPIILLIIIILNRAYVTATSTPDKIYTESFEIDTLDVFKKTPSVPESEEKVELHLAYSPDTSTVFQEIMKTAAASLNVEYSGYPNAIVLEKILKEKNYLAGVEFDDSLAYITKYPEKLNFKLRFPFKLRKHNSDWLTDKHYWVAFSEDKDREGIDGGAPVGYLREGFLPVQHAISTAFIMQAANDKPAALPKINMQRFPEPGLNEFIFDLVVHTIIGNILVFCFFSVSQHIVRSIVEEKQKQLKEVMKIIGLQSWLQWLAWFVCGFLMMMVVTICILVALCINWGISAYLSHSNILLIILFFLAYAIAQITLLFLGTVFFSKATIASVVMGLMFVVTIIPYHCFLDTSLPLQLAICLLPNTAFCAGLKIIFLKERLGDGWHLSNMFLKASADESLSLGIIILMMLLSGFLYMALCLYIEQILPSEFGIPQKWNFPFQKSFWTGEEQHYEEVSPIIKREHPETFEAEPSNGKIGVQIINLSKKFGNHLAVDKVSLNLYENEVTVLLGHNGAGKTTTISMIIGMIKSTSGTAIVNGYDIRKNLTGARSSLSICPQHNILFDCLTVKEHLLFYGSLKGLKGDDLNAEAKHYIKKTNLSQKANVQASKLSGGMKRKLSLSAALCGGTKIVLLDEPSSGLDPTARRQLWDLIISEKNGRTILLTTHFMDEAEILGDRIAILSSGQLQCYGTPFFLKKKYGCGYILICIKKPDCNIAEVTKLLNKYIPGIEPATDIGTELSYRLADADTHRFKYMLQDLESNAYRLNLDGYGISITSLEDVFLKVGTTRQGKVPINLNNLLIDKEDRLKGCALLCYHWRAMMLKKYLYRIRHRFLFAAHIMLPILFGLLLWWLSKSKLISTTYGPEPLQLDLLQFPETVSVLETKPNVKDGSLEEKISNNYKAYVKSLGSNHKLKETGNANFISYILGMGKELKLSIDSQYIAAATVDEGKITAWLNNNPLHTAPITLNVVHNAMARSTIGPKAGINVAIQTLPPNKEEQNDGKTKFSSVESILLFITMFIVFVFPLYVFHIVEERENRVRLLQITGGVKLTTFWITHFLYDYFTFAISALILLITISFSQIKDFKTFNELGREFVLMMVCSLALLPLMYLIAEISHSPSTGYTLAFCVLIFPTIIADLIAKILSPPLIKLIQLIPLQAFSTCHVKLELYNALKEVCKGLEAIAGPLTVCQGWSSFFGWEDPGVLPEILIMLLSSIIFFSILILKDSHFIGSLCDRMWKRQQPVQPDDGYFDQDVELERQKVDDMLSADIAKEPLVLNRVTKYYKRFRAVNQISLIVRKAECFGLLGVNGAGKTSTFKMLIGEENISWGDAYVHGISLKENMEKVHDEIGYCPQFDALFGYFTGREMLKMYCLIRGIPMERISKMSTELAVGLGFMRYYNKLVHSYSGGNKRKLCVAIAVIANPSLIYLDEPTSGMDPAARRHLWDVLCKFRDSGKSLVLTSHSMDECEALCTRLAIMVKGEFKCLGSLQHLKIRFTNGLTLKIKIFQPDNAARKLFKQRRSNRRTTLAGDLLQEDIERVIEFIEDEFPEAQLKDKLETLLTFEIPLTKITWSHIFGLMEANKESLNIEDYSITQTTLDDIFSKMSNIQKTTTRV